MESLSTKLIAPPPEADSFALSRAGCVWRCATKTLDFIGRMEISAAVKHQKLTCQDVVSSRKRSEQIAVWCFIHYPLDLLFVASYLLYERNKLIQNSILQPDFGSDDSLRNLGYRFLHNTVESLSGIPSVDLTIHKQLLNLFGGARCYGFHLGKGINPFQELQSRLVCYATEHTQSLREVFLESAGQLVREPDFLLHKSVSVLQQETEFPDCLIRDLDAPEGSMMFPDIVSDKLSVTLIRFGLRSYSAFSVSCYGLWVSKQDGKLPLDEKIRQPGTWILEANSTVLAVCSMLLKFAHQVRESIVVKVEPVS
jgi:hypothetical protein